ncbi:hypothetical protein HOLDEFILI_03247 [Holdemania filiformis DSM 12042]|uniref:Uncharacterized protein n=1 Tax=Holdemania filiformis DSM 12042 TaxID=545696 RepID=B9YBP0_9FIRM|nr:hypothetical protein HOLDEFILI_03247 [Holdemania filiformis DSM 12042]
MLFRFILYFNSSGIQTIKYNQILSFFFYRRKNIIFDEKEQYLENKYSISYQLFLNTIFLLVHTKNIVVIKKHNKKYINNKIFIPRYVFLKS